MRQRLIARAFNKRRNKCIQLQFVEFHYERDDFDLVSETVPGTRLHLKLGWRSHLRYYRGMRDSYLYAGRELSEGVQKCLWIPRELWPAVEDVILEFNQMGTNNTLSRDDVIIDLDRNASTVAYVAECREKV